MKHLEDLCNKVRTGGRDGRPMPPAWVAAREQRLREWSKWEPDPKKRRAIQAVIDEIRSYSMPRPIRGRPLPNRRSHRGSAPKVEEEAMTASQESLFKHKQPEA